MFSFLSPIKKTQQTEKKQTPFEKTFNDNYGDLLTLFRTTPKNVAVALDLLYPITVDDSAESEDANSDHNNKPTENTALLSASNQQNDNTQSEQEKLVQKNREKREKFLAMLDEINIVYQALKQKGAEPSLYFFSNYANMLSSLYQDPDNLNDPDPSQALFTKFIQNMNWLADVAEKKGMARSFIFFNIATVLLCTVQIVTKLVGGQWLVPVETVLSSTEISEIGGEGWNTSDGALTVPSVIAQATQGEKDMAKVNALGITQVLAATTLVFIASDTFFSPVVQLPATAIFGLMGFSFALGMLIPMGLELYAAGKCQKRIDALQNAIIERLTEENKTLNQALLSAQIVSNTVPILTPFLKEKIPEIKSELSQTIRPKIRKQKKEELVALQDDLIAALKNDNTAIAQKLTKNSTTALTPALSSPTSAAVPNTPNNSNATPQKVDKTIQALETALTLEKIQLAQHRRTAAAWGGCFIGMMAIAVIGFVALSGVSLGTVPAAMLVVASIALIAGLVRQTYINGIDIKTPEIKTLGLKSCELVKIKSQKERDFDKARETDSALTHFKKNAISVTGLPAYSLDNNTNLSTINAVSNSLH